MPLTLQDWKPRKFMTLYVAIFFIASFSVSVCLETLVVSRTTTLSVFVVVLLTLGFAYSNFVTTARSSCFRGKHGGFRDIATVLLLSPLCVFALWLPGLHNDLFNGHVEHQVQWRFSTAAMPRWLDSSATKPAVLPLLDAGGSAPSALFVPLSAHIGAFDGASSDAAVPGAAEPIATALLASVDDAGTAVSAPVSAWAYSLQQLWHLCVEFASSHVSLMVLLLSYIGGLHMPYLTRTGLLSRSISAVDVATSSVGGFVGLAFKLTFIFSNIAIHIAWALGQGFWNCFLPRAALYCSIWGSIIYISSTRSQRYYLHFHHWFAGIVLLPFCVSNYTNWSMVVVGISLSQFVEGAARWSCAPLWHAYPPAAVDASSTSMGSNVSEVGRSSGSDLVHSDTTLVSLAAEDGRSGGVASDSRDLAAAAAASRVGDSNALYYEGLKRARLPHLDSVSQLVDPHARSLLLSPDTRSSRLESDGFDNRNSGSSRPTRSIRSRAKT